MEKEFLYIDYIEDEIIDQNERYEDYWNEFTEELASFLEEIEGE